MRSNPYAISLPLGVFKNMYLLVYRIRTKYYNILIILIFILCDISIE